MVTSMESKVALVTGAGSGIGRATALAFAEQGYRVVVSDIFDDHGKETVAMIADAGGEAIYLHADVAKPEEVKALVDGTIDAFGRVDAAFNNAGIEGESAPTADCSEENWDRVIDINLKGAWLCMREEIPHMLRQGGGSIVNCASVAGLVGFAGIPAYTASKHGLVGLTKAAALEYATQGIRINAVCPGVIDTSMIERFTHGSDEEERQMVAMEPMGRMGQPEEIASAVVWLCSSGAGFVTGTALTIDGGLVAR